LRLQLSTGLAQDTTDRIIYESDTGELYYDGNGNAAGGGVLSAKVTVGVALNNVDFSVREPAHSVQLHTGRPNIASRFGGSRPAGSRCKDALVLSA
jgi:hypothetical protein